jgi:hypothetical protein
MRPPSRSANKIHTQTGRLLRIKPDGGGTISGSSGSAVTVAGILGAAVRSNCPQVGVHTFFETNRFELEEFNTPPIC